MPNHQPAISASAVEQVGERLDDGRSDRRPCHDGFLAVRGHSVDTRYILAAERGATMSRL
jgi:hypothetical protein